MNSKTCHCQMSVRPKELLDSCAPLQSISHSRRKNNSRSGWTDSLIYNSNSCISKSHLKCSMLVFLLMLYTNITPGQTSLNLVHISSIYLRAFPSPFNILPVSIKDHNIKMFDFKSRYLPLNSSPLNSTEQLLFQTPGHYKSY